MGGGSFLLLGADRRKTEALFKRCPNPNLGSSQRPPKSEGLNQMRLLLAPESLPRGRHTQAQPRGPTRKARHA